MVMKISRGDSLDRYYLFNLFGFGAFLHRIHHNDPLGTYHSHPWSGLSIILGSYWEAHLDQQPKPGVYRFVKKSLFNWVKAKRHHNVQIDKPVWTIFLHLPKSNQWEVVDESGNKSIAPWEGDKGHKSYTEAIGPQRATPASVAKVNAEVRPTRNLLPANSMEEMI